MNMQTKSKRAKVAKQAAAFAPLASVLSPQLHERVPQLKKEFLAGKPFPHVSISQLCTPAAAQKLHEEIRQLQGTIKETDLFKVIQTGDLANADESDAVHADKLKHLLALRRELNSDSFRKMIEEITGCGSLSNQVDLSANAYTRGCHLLCHDDVIGSRRVSYIVYLSDPDEPWLDEDGGRLELYPADDHGLPQAEPSTRVLPTFNSLAMFIVEPGVSYHSVEEVFSEDKPRISLQGWFHASNPPKDYERATLQQILNPAIKTSMQGEESSVESHLEGHLDFEFLSAADLEELRTWVTPDYLTKEALGMICAKCASEDNCVSLEKFIQTDVANRLREAIRKSEAMPADLDKWNVVGPAHLRRHLQLKSFSRDDSSSTEALLNLLQSKMQSPAFTRFLRLCIGDLLPVTRRGEIRRFRKGSDYTVAYAHQDASVVDCTLCFVLDETDEAINSWRSGEVGGFELYLNKEEDGKGDVAVYARNQESEGVVSVDPAFGTLCLVYRDDTQMRFVKYVSKIAPSDRYDISMTYTVAEDVECDDDEDEEES